MPPLVEDKQSQAVIKIASPTITLEKNTSYCAHVAVGKLISTKVVYAIICENVAENRSFLVTFVNDDLLKKET